MIRSDASTDATSATNSLAIVNSAKPKPSRPPREQTSSFDQQKTSRSPSEERPSAATPSDANDVSSAAFDPLVEHSDRAKRLRELAQSMDRTLQRISQFFKPEDLRRPPGPPEIQRRIADIETNSTKPASPNDPTEKIGNAKESINREVKPEVSSILDVMI